jgi:hypothetical protein
MKKNQTFKNIVKFLQVHDYEFEYDEKLQYIVGDFFLFNREKKGKRKIIALHFSLDAPIQEVSIFSQKFSWRFGEIEVRESYYLDGEELLLGEKAQKCFEVILRNRPLTEEKTLSPQIEKLKNSPPEKRKWNLGKPRDTDGWTVLRRRG